jgi:hypothetical protein
MSYFILTSSEDGTTIEKISKDELTKRITPDEDGYLYYGDIMPIKFLDSIPDSDNGHWLLNDCDDVVSVLVIKGDIVQSKKVEVVHKYEF